MLQQEYEDFCQKHSFWLDDYVLFEVLRNNVVTGYGIKPAGLRDRNKDSLIEIESYVLIWRNIK